MARATKSGAGRASPPKPRARRAKPPAAKLAIPDAPVEPTPEPIPPPPAGAPAPRRSQNRGGGLAAGLGAIAVLILVGANFLVPRPAPRTAPKVAAVVERQARALCSLDPARSFNTPLGTPSVAFTIDPARGCENAVNPYERTAAGFSRIIPNAGAGVVSSLDIAADLTTLQRRDFPLSAKESAALHVALGPSKALRCSPSDAPATIAAIRSRLARIRALAQPYLSRRPVRQITWRCRP